MADEPVSRRDPRSDGRIDPAAFQQATRGLLDASVVVFGDCGFESAKLADIARRCGLTTGAIYTRWDNKQHLFAAAVGHALELSRSNALLDLVDAGDSAGDPLEALLKGLVSPKRDHLRNLAVEAYAVSMRDPSVREDALPLLVADIEAIEYFVALGQEMGTVDASLNAEAVALCCQTLAVGVHLVLTVIGDEPSRPARDEWVDLLMLFVAAIAPAEPESGTAGNKE